MNMTAQIIELPIATKICSKCRQEKSLSAFGNRYDRSCGKRSACKICDSRYKKGYAKNIKENRPERSEEIKKLHRRNSREWRLKNKDRMRHNNYKWNYGIGLNDVHAMLQGQMGLCANRACGKFLTIGGAVKDRAYVDHNHETGDVRGLLCHNCNTSLGLLEKKNLVLGLTEYLQKYGSI